MVIETGSEQQKNSKSKPRTGSASAKPTARQAMVIAFNQTLAARRKEFVICPP
jgi:hypothetical protein